MPRYYHDISHYHQVRFIRRYKRFIILIIGLLLLTGALLLVDSYVQSRKGAIASEPTTKEQSTYSKPVNILRTSYFQFQASTNWTFIASESTDTHFVYKKQKSNLVEQQLDIYVNEAHGNDAISYVLPVGVSLDRTLDPGKLSERCKGEKNPTVQHVSQPVTVSGVPITCDLSTNAYRVGIGIPSVGTTLRLARQNGTFATYNIFFLDTTVSPSTIELSNMMDSFQAL